MSNFDEILTAARTQAVDSTKVPERKPWRGTRPNEKSSQLGSYKRVLSLDEIRDRPHKDTRTINPYHVEELVASISALSLIQPIAVDRFGHLLAGGHRREALRVLRETEPETFEKHFPGGQIPVRVYDFKAAENEALATAIEAAENEKRRDYTPSEVRELAGRLLAAGYKEVKGRPTRGQKALKPALATIIGKSTKTVQRYLNSDTKSGDINAQPASTAKEGETGRKDGHLSTFSKWTKVLTEIEQQAPEIAPNGEQAARLAKKLKAEIQQMTRG